MSAEVIRADSQSEEQVRRRAALQAVLDQSLEALAKGQVPETILKLFRAGELPPDQQERIREILDRAGRGSGG